MNKYVKNIRKSENNKTWNLKNKKLLKIWKTWSQDLRWGHTKKQSNINGLASGDDVWTMMVAPQVDHNSFIMGIVIDL